jgi:hypothetical protein
MSHRNADVVTSMRRWARGAYRKSRVALALGALLGASAETAAAAAPTFLHGESMTPWAPTGDSLGTTYSGGRVLGDVQVVAVFWGPNVSPTITSGIGGFYSAYVAASQIGWMCEYNTQTQSIGSGSFAGNFTITPTVNTGTSITDANIQDELAGQINAGHLPAPNANTIYMVHFPPGTTITSSSGTSCVQFCAYHDAATRTINGSSTTFPYAVIPDFTQDCTGCGDRSAFDNLSKSASHELAEAITDAVPPTGWTNADGEIGDPCNFHTLGDAAYYNFTSGGTTYAAQLEWSHNSSSCVPGSQCATCNPFLASCTTTIPPDTPFTGPLFFSVSSSGCASTGPRTCNNSIQITPGTTIPQKCNALVTAINSDCGASASFQADASKCASGTFTVVDTACNAQAPTGNGVSLLLSNAQGTLQGSGLLPDYEQDVITNGCQGGGDSLVMLSGAPTGAAINGNQSSVVFVVSTPDIGQVIETVQTTKQMTASQVVAQLVSLSNGALTAFQSNVRCSVDPITPSLAHCTSTPPFVDGGEGSRADAPASGVPVSFQVNDTGMTRAILAGPAKDVVAAKQTIHAAGGIPNVLKLNFVGGPTCSPCNGGMQGPTCCASAAPAPALDGVSTMALGLAFVAMGFALARRGVARRI